MAYNAVAQQEDDELTSSDRASNRSGSPADVSEQQHVATRSFRPLQTTFVNRGPNSLGLFMDPQHEDGSISTGGLSVNAHSIFSRSTKSSYDALEEEDDHDDSLHDSRRTSPISSELRSRGKDVVVESLKVQRTRRRPENTPVPRPNNTAPTSPNIVIPEPLLRSASGRSLPLRHPTPDLHVLQGAFMANVEHLEKTAEKLSMTSSIEEAIKQMHDEQKRSDSRKSSLLNSPVDSPLSRQFSNPSSIVDVNNAARSGGYSPGGYNMISPREAVSTSSRLRSSSKASRLSSRPEPELEGRPLDSFVSTAAPAVTAALSRNASIEEDRKVQTTKAAPVLDSITREPSMKLFEESGDGERPTTSASTNTFEQAQRLFSDFDGEHYKPKSREVSDSNRSAASRPSLPRPKSYADPATGQTMVYYPAPVPMMLNLPQKLSKLPSQATRDKRRSQVLSTIPAAARQSAVWLPDVLEGLQEDEAENDGAQDQEYVPQHQRRSMGGRRSTTDLLHMPPQLRASAFFDQPLPTPKVELKGDSAVKTLDDILNASAYAPVSAFTDHAFAGRLGAEVYGKENKRLSKSTSQMLETDALLKKSDKRTSTFSLLRGRRKSSSELLTADEKNNQRAATMSGAMESRTFGVEEDDRGDMLAAHLQGTEEDLADEENGDVYRGAPTTLLAELQLRKQEQKRRTRPLGSAYPNGMHSTLLELDAVAQIEKQARKQKRVNLAWEAGAEEENDEEDEDEDVPLALLYANKPAVNQDVNRPLGLMERRDLEENEPLSARRDRLLGRAPLVRASTMNVLSPMPHFEDGEKPAEQVQSPKEEENDENPLPAARPVSGDFTSELMSQFGENVLSDAKDDVKGKDNGISSTPPAEEEETLGQRRKRLQAERAAREKEVGTGAGGDVNTQQRPPLKPRHSMADILQAHPAAGASRSSSYNLNGTSNSGLLGMYDQQQQQHRASTMIGNEYWLAQAQQPFNGGFKGGMYNDGVGGIVPQQGYGNQYMSGYLPGYNQYGHMQYTTPYGQMGYGNNGWYNMQANPIAAYQFPMGAAQQPLSQGQMDMVERWRQSILQ